MRAWATLAVLAGLSASAFAGEKEDQLSAAGARERAGDREGALVALERAFEVSHDPLILYDVGRMRQSTGRLAGAIEAFDRFVAEAPGAPRIYRQDAERRSADLRRQVRMVEIRSDVPGARVTVDSHLAGETPLARPVAVDPGAHRITLEKQGYDPYERILAATETLVEAHLAVRPAPVAPAAAPPSLPVPVASPPQITAVAEAPEPVEEAAPGGTSIALSAGGMLWSPTTAVAAPAPSLALGVSHAVLELGSDAGLWLGGKMGLAWLRAGSTALLVPALVTSALRWPLAERWRGSVGVEGGLVLMTGVKPESPLLESGAVSEVKSPGLFGWELRVGAGVDYALGPRLSLFVAPQLIVDPKPTSYFTTPAITRLETTVGVAFRP